jgi:hypothetical protein
VTIFNRRNALIGWATLTVGKRVAKRKLRQAVPSVPLPSVEVPERARRFGRRAKASVPSVEMPEKARRFARKAKEALPAPEPERRRRRRAPRALAFLAALGVGVATYLRRGRNKPPDGS